MPRVVSRLARYPSECLLEAFRLLRNRFPLARRLWSKCCLATIHLVSPESKNRHFVSEFTIDELSGGTEGSRTLDLHNAIEALSQLSCSPTLVSNYGKSVLLAQLPSMHYQGFLIVDNPLALSLSTSSRQACPRAVRSWFAVRQAHHGLTINGLDGLTAKTKRPCMHSIRLPCVSD